MSIKASEITDLIQARIKNFDAATEARNVGTVVSVTDGICRVQAGAGIVADSVPETEDAEAESKAGALFAAVELAREWFARP